MTLDRRGLGAAFPGVTGWLVLFVHGLAETGLAWVGRDDASRPWSYAHTLETHGWTGAAVRYNTGLAVAANGMSLASLIDELVTGWTVPVTDVALVGHSMGLVIRSACSHAVDAGHGWPGLVRSCVYLGSPHHGPRSSRESTFSAASWVPSPKRNRWPPSSALRSAGIRDLGHGLLTADRDDPLADSGGGTLLEGARHHLVAAHLGTSERHPAAVLLGDLIVRPTSALGLGNRRTVALDRCERATFPSTSHQGLLKNHRIAEALVGWLA